MNETEEKKGKKNPTKQNLHAFSLLVICSAENNIPIIELIRLI